MRWIVITLILLAGCADSETASSSDDPPPSGGPERESTETIGTGPGPDQGATATFWLNDTATLTMRTSTIFSNSASGNCIIFDSGDFALIAGTVNATWTPESMFTDQLQLRTVARMGNNESASTFQSSPLSWSVDQTFPVNGTDDALLMALFTAENSASVAQEVTVSYNLEFRGAMPTARPNSGCAF